MHLSSDELRSHWERLRDFRPRKETGYYPIPLILLCAFVFILLLRRTGSIFNLVKLSLYYSVWVAAAAAIWYAATATLNRAEQDISPERSRLRLNLYGIVVIALGLGALAATLYIAFLLHSLW